MSMRWRLLGSFALIILIALGTVAIVSRITTEQELQAFLGHGGQVGLENLANSLEAYYAENGSWENVESILTAGQGRGQGQRSGGAAFGRAFALTDVSGMVLFSSTKAEQGTNLPEETLARALPLEVSGERVGFLYPQDGLLDLPEDFEELLIERVNQASLLAGLISGGIAILIALVLAALILRPVRDLTTAAQKMTRGDLSQRVQVHGEDEMATLGKTFNQMSRSLQEAEARRMALTADIAHELRNPLAIQRAHLEALQDGVYPLTQDNLTLLAEQNQQLTRLVEDLRTLALADAGELTLNKRPIDLVPMCQETLTRFAIQAKAKDIQLTAECGMGAVLVHADKERLQQIHDNLMQNALRYTPEGGFIKLTLEQQAQHAIFSIYNNGPQLSPEAQRHLFERFYRTDKARDRASGGTGLGLAIARKLAEAHGGTLTGENHPAGGVIFKLSLPNL
jgi:signal transduction histidine kinase